MKIFTKILPSFLTLCLLTVFASPTVHAKKSGCWVDIFDDVHYRGNKHRISGPKKLPNLVNIKGKNWDKKIESIIVGPNAVTFLFENKNFKFTLAEMSKHPVLMKSLGITEQDVLDDSELIFQPGVKVHNFGEFHFNHKIRSMKVNCVK